MKKKLPGPYYTSLGAKIRALRLCWREHYDIRAWVRISGDEKRWSIEFWPFDEKLPAIRGHHEYRDLKHQNMTELFALSKTLKSIKSVKKGFTLQLDDQDRPI